MLKMPSVTFLLLGVDGQDAEKLGDQVVRQQVHPEKITAHNQNTKRFKRTLIYYDTQYAHFQGNPLRQATK